MIEHNFPEQMQLFLNEFLFDIRLRKETLDHFVEMYDDELYNYVCILKEIVYGDATQQSNIEPGKSPLALDVLNHLKKKSFENFVIVVTHFKDFLYLLNEWKMFYNFLQFKSHWF